MRFAVPFHLALLTRLSRGRRGPTFDEEVGPRRHVCVYRRKAVCDGASGAGRHGAYLS